MEVSLDAKTESRIQREIDRGHYRKPAEVVARAVELLDIQEDWLEQNRDIIADRIEESFHQIERGEGISSGQARAELAERKARRG